MAGIVFLRTHNLKMIVDFYVNKINASIWLEQEGCTILKHGNFLFGFCEREGDLGHGWLLTFFYKHQKSVDDMYNLLKDTAVSKPEKNEKYNLYQFFAKDPEDRDLEFQVFLNDIDFEW